MFKSGLYLSANKLSEFSVSGVQHNGGPNEKVSGSFFSGSAFGMLDVWGYYDRKRLVFSSVVYGSGDPVNVQALQKYCNVTYEANSCCGTDSYGNPNSCDITRFGGYDYSAYSFAGMFTAYTASQFKDVAVAGDSGVDFATHCNISDCNLSWGSYSNNTYAVIKQDGTLWIWGDNPHGQVGNGTTTGQFDPVQIGSDTNWERIMGGHLYFLALKQDGTLWSWGYNNYGQLGDGTTTSRSSPVQIGSDTAWVDISPGRTHSVAVKSDGTLWAWGANYWGNLGDGTNVNKSSPVQVSGTTWKKAVAANNDNTVALRTDGTMWSWGYNGYGNVGDGTYTSRSSPVQIGSSYTWKDCKSQYAITTDHKLYNWGQTSYGGNGILTPTQVGSDAVYSKLPSGYQGGIFVSGLSNPGYDTGLAVIDRTGGIQVFTSTSNSGKSVVYIGGGVRKVVGSYTGIFILKDGFSAYKGPDGSVSANTILGPNPSSLNYGHSAYFPTPNTVLIDVPGTHSIAVPPDMNYMHVVCIGGGGSGGSGDVYGRDGGGGGGGALAYKNNISVTAGNTVRVVVGHGGDVVGFGVPSATGFTGNAGGPSYIVYNSTSYAYAGGGSGGHANGSMTAGGGTRGFGTYDGGGDGGTGGGSTYSITGGGGGAAGYTAGTGGSGASSALYGGAGTGGSAAGGNTAQGGGGVGIFAIGTSGAAGSIFSNGGGAGSGGTNGGGGYGSGGTYGGGGSGGFYDNGASFNSGGAGGRGAVRILFSNGGNNIRTYPNNSGNPTNPYGWT